MMLHLYFIVKRFYKSNLVGYNVLRKEFTKEIMERKLSDYKIGQAGTVTKVLGEGAIRRRLFDMGVTPGAEVYLRKKAPLGDPIEIRIRGYELTLRKAEADLVITEIRK